MAVQDVVATTDRTLELPYRDVYDFCPTEDSLDAYEYDFESGNGIHDEQDEVSTW